MHRALPIGGSSLIGAELLIAYIYFSPQWRLIATGIVHAGGTPAERPEAKGTVNP